VGSIKQKSIRYFVTVLVILVANFLIPRIMPGNPVMYLIGEDAVTDSQTIAELKKELHLDQPLHIQFLNYCADLSRFHLGYSYFFRKSVSGLILSRLPWTLGLLIPSIVIGALWGISSGALAGWKKQNRWHRLVTHAAIFLFSIPSFFLAMIMLFIFAVQFNIFPVKGFYQSGTIPDIIRHYTLPVLVLSLVAFARNFIIMRGSVLSELNQPYVLFARAKGVPERKILYRHIFKNALLPLISLIALDFGFLVSGALFVEIGFSLNGMGTLVYDAILNRDYPLIQGLFVVITIMVILANLLADGLHQILDPRLKKQQ
jgi:peptide/nickel transport system permease protein